MIYLAKDKELEFSDKIQALYFYATWMTYHKKMSVMIEKIEQKYKDVEFLAIDTDYFGSFTKRFEVSSIPTVIVLKNGKELSRINGMPLTSAFKKFFVDIYNLGDENGKEKRKKH